MEASERGILMLAEEVQRIENARKIAISQDEQSMTLMIAFRDRLDMWIVQDGLGVGQLLLTSQSLCLNLFTDGAMLANSVLAELSETHRAGDTKIRKDIIQVKKSGELSLECSVVLLLLLLLLQACLGQRMLSHDRVLLLRRRLDHLQHMQR
jgi:hypothetical protein